MSIVKEIKETKQIVKSFNGCLKISPKNISRLVKRPKAYHSKKDFSWNMNENKVKCTSPTFPISDPKETNKI